VDIYALKMYGFMSMSVRELICFYLVPLLSVLFHFDH
jgi:hypothetical protein